MRSRAANGRSWYFFVMVTFVATPQASGCVLLGFGYSLDSER